MPRRSPDVKLKITEETPNVSALSKIGELDSRANTSKSVNKPPVISAQDASLWDT